MTTDAQLSGSRPTLAASTVLANRYQIKEEVHASSLTTVYRATDGFTGEAVLVHVLAPGLDIADHRDANTAAFHAAGPLDHASIAPPIEVKLGGEAEQPGFVVTRDSTATNLRDLLARRVATTGTGFAARGALRIIASVCEALAAAHDRGVCHGALSADSMVIDDSGQVTVMDFGLGATLARAVHGRGNGASGDGAVIAAPLFLAPEARTSGELGPEGDVFAVGQLLYELLVGRPLQRGGPRPSDVAPGLPPAMDEFIARSVLPDPEARPALAALGDAVQSALQAVQAMQAPVAATAVSVDEPSLAQSLPPGALTVDPALLANTDEKWLVSKGRLDYGPYTLAEVVEQIEKGVIIAGNVLVDNHSGERCFVEEHPLLADLVARAKQTRDDERRAQAEAVHVKKEKVRGTMLYAIIAGGVLVLGLIVYLIVDRTGGKDSTAESQGINVVGEGGLNVAIRFQKSKSGDNRSRSGSRRPRGSSGGDDTLELDLSDESGGSETLDTGVIDGVIQRSGSRLGSCLVKNGGGKAAIEFIIKGPTGRVSWVKVNGQQSGGLFDCINGVMRGMKFPTVDGPRTRAEFEMEL